MEYELREEIIQLMKEVVTLDIDKKYGSFGESDYFIIKLKIAGEVISENYVNLDG